MKVEAACSLEVATIQWDENLIEAAVRMREGHVGTLVVVRDEDADQLDPMGILTDRDIVVGVLADGGEDIANLRVGDVLARHLITATLDDDLDDALDRMCDAGIRRVVVVDVDGALAGVLAMDDILETTVDRLYAMVGLVRRGETVERALRDRQGVIR